MFVGRPYCRYLCPYGGLLAWCSRLAARGVTISLAAGVLGALGAACVIWAFQNGGKPLYVMPLVFAGAPVVNALISMATHPGEIRTAHPLLFVGIVLAASGAWLILRYVPH